MKCKKCRKCGSEERIRAGKYTRCKPCSERLHRAYIDRSPEKYKITSIRPSEEVSVESSRAAKIVGSIGLESKTPGSRMLSSAKARARKKGLPFNLTEEDIVVPEVCPALGVPVVANTATAPSLDRIDNTKGYVKGNVWVISRRANTMKCDATLEELEMLVAALKKISPSF